MTNICDLHSLYQFLTQTQKFKLGGFIAHSYGAKLLYDTLQKYHIGLPSIFVSTAASILTPRINNLLLDLAYLKETDPEKYQAELQQLDDKMTLTNIWQLTESLAPLFNKNPNRRNFYWANMEVSAQAAVCEQEHEQKTNPRVFKEVRQDLYSHAHQLSVDITTLANKTLLINGFHDVIMEGASHLLKPQSAQHQHTVFTKSAHYPHLEENEKFCQVVNAFIQ